MKFVTLIAIFLSLLGCIKANATSINAKNKYPYVLLGNTDYGILNEDDLGAFSWGRERRPFNPKSSMGYYWQCFPREVIKIILKDIGTSSAEVGGKENIADLNIEVWINPNLIYEYEMRARWPVADFEKRFNKWRNIMKQEKYVCLAGEYVNYEHKTSNGMETDVYGWIFEKIKTKKGCDSYLFNCHQTYQEYLQEKSKRQFNRSLNSSL